MEKSLLLFRRGPGIPILWAVFFLLRGLIKHRPALAEVIGVFFKTAHITDQTTNR
jgi:hypothetical protein